MKLHTILGVALGCAALAGPVSAVQVVYVATLSGPAEFAPNSSPGIGTAQVMVDFDLLTMHVEASFSGLLGNVTASHIHCCTAAPNTGAIGVATVTPTFTGFPSGVTSGSYDHTFDMTLAASYNAPFLTAQGGTTAGAFAALVAGMNNSTSYFNIHSSQFPGGEIRGFLAPIPEPQTYALMLLGLAAVGAASRRRQPH